MRRAPGVTFGHVFMLGRAHIQPQHLVCMLGISALATRNGLLPSRCAPGTLNSAHIEHVSVCD